ncbi:MAG: UDP-N-acetylmuramate--L-alanine ligase [Ignavibacteria bacterium]|nr:UDP-N-acetylmuramate--L-alanine ligase [Ignavibacteria bacterium]
MQKKEKNIKILKNVRTVHFIGIGGIGMCGLAEYLLVKGFRISGSDITRTFITQRLEKKGARIKYGHKASNVGKEVDLVVHTSAVKTENPELKEAVERKIKTVKRAFLLGELVNGKYLIAVSGTHGKTSTTAMIAKVLIDAKLDPTVFVGGNLEFLGGASYRIGKGKYAVVEADEYDRSFHTLKPAIAVINNVELDHTDIYKTEKDIVESFKTFANGVKSTGYFVVNMNDRNVKKVMNDRICRRADFGKGCINDISGVKADKTGITYKLNETDIRLSILGYHNVFNSAAAFITGSLVNIKPPVIIKSLEEFPGVKRRLELKYRKDISVYDDYAHHPTEVASSLKSINEVKEGRLIVVYQPHTFTRTREFYKDFANALRTADVVYLMPVYPARELPIKGVTSKLIYDKIKNTAAKKVLVVKTDKLNNALKKEIKKGDYIVFQGAGDITNFCDEFIKGLKK